MVVFSLPLIFIIFLFSKPVASLDKENKVTWGRLYQDLRIRNKWKAAHWFIFVLRRLIIAIICFYVQNCTIQIIIMLYMNIAIMIYVGHNRPLNTGFKNKLDLLNECFISNATYHMLLFTDWTLDEHEQYIAGWSMIINLAVCYIINLLCIIWVVIQNCLSAHRIYIYNFKSVSTLL